MQYTEFPIHILVSHGNHSIRFYIPLSHSLDFCLITLKTMLSVLSVYISCTVIDTSQHLNLRWSSGDLDISTAMPKLLNSEGSSENGIAIANLKNRFKELITRS